jgi:hypothetical protein
MRTSRIQRFWVISITVGAMLFMAGCGSGESAVEALKNARTANAAVEALDRLQKEKSGDLLAGAYCTTVGSYTSKGKAPSSGDWGRAILAAAGEPASQLGEKADELGTTLDLAQTNATAAHAYARACLLRKDGG